MFIILGVVGFNMVVELDIIFIGFGMKNIENGRKNIIVINWIC